MKPSALIPKRLPLRHSIAPGWWSRELPAIEALFDELISENLGSDARIILKAKEFAHRSHAGQFRQGGGDYIIHPLRVAISLIDELGIADRVMILGSVLHDVIEDSDHGGRDLAAEFGSEVSDLVSMLSRLANEKRPPKGDSPDSSYFNRIKASGPSGVVLKVADKVDNLRDALYHPSEIKRQVYVGEVDRVYIPLVRSLQDGQLQRRLEALLTSVKDSHSLKSLIRVLDEQTKAAEPGCRVVVPPACLGAPLLHYSLFNPSLAHWLSDDGVQLTKSVLSSQEIAANVARKYAESIDYKRREILEVAGISEKLPGDRNSHFWNKTKQQWRNLADFLESKRDPKWCEPIFEPESSQWLLLLVHSVLLRPANWIYPMWHDDYGAQLAENAANGPYKQLSPSNARDFHSFLQFLLTKREALWRLFSGAGTLTRARSVFKAARRCSAVPPRTLWSLRLLSEYLDARDKVPRHADASSVTEGFVRLWSILEEASFQSEALGRMQGQLLKQKDKLRPVLVGDIEILGLKEMRPLFAPTGELEPLLKLLMTHCRTGFRKGSDKWISFEVSEFLKRQEFFNDRGRRRIDGRTRWKGLEGCGIRCEASTSKSAAILKVFPAKRFALQNRLPELSKAEMGRIQAASYSATEIFDALILEQMNNPKPVWIPRVYRILDTIEDLDPDNVQAIRITFRGPEEDAEIESGSSAARVEGSGSTEFKTLLPLPREEGQGSIEQDRRKEIVARYIVAQMYNHGVTRRLLSAHVECARLPDSRAADGFTNESLMKMIGGAEVSFGFRGSYGGFIESFNFSSFRINEDSGANGDFPFDQADMKSGAFLGIDIGGTDVKFALFVNGKVQALKRGTLGKIKTFSNKPVDAYAFCARLISKISEWFDNARGIWAGISAVGISWAGAVRDNRIVCFSKTLQGLTYQGRGFDRDSPPTVIHSFPFLDIFEKALRKIAKERKFQLNSTLTFTLENDGNAEAFGNYSMRVMTSDSKKTPGGTLVIKLGTSLAGARVLPQSSIAGDVGEFSKIVLNLNVSEATDPQGLARDYVSSLGVRNLSRTFKFLGKPLFGLRGTENTDDRKETCIEAVELGMLLCLWQACVDEENRDSYMNELVLTRNQPGGSASKRLMRGLHKLLSDGSLKRELSDYIMARGKEWSGRGIVADADKSDWQKGLKRVNWLCTGKWEDYPGIPDSTLPITFPFDALAEKIIGTVVLFSQLGFQIAHTVVALYNIYRKDLFNKVILAGGVLSGVTGDLVKAQTESFLLKYYDKIYGPGKNLPLDSIHLTKSGDRELLGPLGAAMLANRAHKSARLKAMHRLIDLKVSQLSPGDSLQLAKVVTDLNRTKLNASTHEVQDYLYTKVANSILIREADGKTFIRSIEASR
jgi:hypothetical protein